MFYEVHNNFIREVQIVNKFTKDIALSINNFDEVMKGNGWNEKWDFKKETFMCPPPMMKTNECTYVYHQYRFDVQDIEIIVN